MLAFVIHQRYVISTISDDVSLMTFSASSILEEDKDAIFNGEENITFADFLQVPVKEFLVLGN